MRGYFAIGIYHPKTPTNVGTLWRSAYQLGASEIFVIGPRYPQQSSDTRKAWRHIPYREYESFDALKATLPYSCPLVAVEMDGKKLSGFHHPERAVYLLGAEDHGLPKVIIEQCHFHVRVEAQRTESYNVAVVGSIVMYHRVFIQGSECGRYIE